MSTAASRRQFLSELSSSSHSRGRRKGWRIGLSILGGLGVLLLLVGGGVWYWWWSSTTDPRVLAIVQQGEQLRERFFPPNSQVASGGGMSQTDADELAAAMTSIRGQMEQLPEHLRPAAGMQIGRMFFTGMQQQMDSYFETPPAQRQAMLDQHIFQMEAMRTAFARNGGSFGGPPGVPTVVKTQAGRPGDRPGRAVLPGPVAATRAAAMSGESGSSTARALSSVPAGPNTAMPSTSGGTSLGWGTHGEAEAAVSSSVFTEPGLMSEILGLLAEGMQLASDLGYRVREEPLGDLPGGGCVVGGTRQILLNLEQGPGERLDQLLDVLAGDPATADEPKSRALAARLQERQA